MPNGRLLIVDDETIVREAMRDWLKDSCYEVEIAESGEEALDKIRKQEFDVMVLDIRLPGESGMSILAKARAIQPRLQSIVFTAYPSEETVAEAKKLGVIEYLVKPIVPDDLEKLISSAIESVRKENSSG
jgi:DNA-binding NtrC family response regulator